MIKTYSELIKIPTFEERFRYLKLSGLVGEETFGYDRYLNQAFYHSDEWQSIRSKIIIRDDGCDLGMKDHDISGSILIHHMNPITKENLIAMDDFVLNPEYLICVSRRTHNAIHYGDESILMDPIIERSRNDTCPWRK